MEENRLIPRTYLYGNRAAPEKEVGTYDSREYRTELHGCKVTVRFSKHKDTELAKKTIAPLMHCFEERVSAEKTA